MYFCLKATGVIFLLLLFILIFDLIKTKKLKLKKLSIKKKFYDFFSFFSLLIIFIWFLKNYIISGCLIYPITHLCFDVSWYNEQNLLRDLNLISKYKEHYSTILNFIYVNIYNLNYLLVFTCLLIFF